MTTYRDLRPGRFAKRSNVCAPRRPRRLRRRRAEETRPHALLARQAQRRGAPAGAIRPLQRRNRLPVSGGDRRSRLRKVPLPAGAPVDRDKIEAGPDDLDAAARAERALGWELKWLPPEAVEFDLLDKPIVLDAAQEAVRRHAPPLVIIGPAGSGKTAVTLAKMREATGDVLYVTLSAYLAQTARRLYGAHGYENPRQNAEFMSFREFVDSIAVPEGEELRFAAFRAWFERRRGGLKGDLRQADAHALLEEFRGVLGAPAGGALTEAEYQALGVRQSLYPEGEARAAVHELFEKYRAWLKEEKLLDLNLVAHAWRAKVEPRYDFVVVDEVQDFTNAELALILGALKSQGPVPAVRRFAPDRASQFLFLGFGARAVLATAAGRRGRVRGARNLRAADQFPQHPGRHRPRQPAAQDQAGALRLGRPREQFPRPMRVQRGGRGATARGRRQGSARADAASRASVRYAVIVLRDEDKAAARAHLGTPLVFSVHEAKGLEYPHVVLLGMVSANRGAYAEVCGGVTPGDLKATNSITGAHGTRPTSRPSSTNSTSTRSM